MLDGKPLAGAEVSLVSVQKNVNAQSISSITDEEGNVTFRTKDVDGVFPGSYIVTVSQKVEEKMLTNNEIRAFAEIGIRYKPKIVETVPEKYTRSETTDLKIKVGYWSSNNLTFNLWSEKSLP